MNKSPPKQENISNEWENISNRNYMVNRLTKIA